MTIGQTIKLGNRTFRVTKIAESFGQVISVTIQRKEKEIKLRPEQFKRWAV